MAIQYNTNKNTPLIIDVNQLINETLGNNWTILNNKLVHDNSVGSYIDNTYSFLTEGKNYKITYDATWANCNFRVYLGNTQGALRSQSGLFTEDLVFTGNNKRLRFWSDGKVTINSIKIQELQLVVTEQELPLNDSNYVENKSFTLSYYPQKDQWVSFHSYLPNNYVVHPNSLLIKNNDSQLMKVNTGDYGKYFDNNIKSFIIETIFNEYPTQTKVFDNITINLKSELAGKDTNKFFDKAVLYTEYQCSGEITLDLSNLTKKERNWMFNKFNDLCNNSSQNIFTSDWPDIQSLYPIDKVINLDRVDNSKPWYQRGRLRDKFLCVRFTENNLENQKIKCIFVSTVYRPSVR